ncbi:MAG: formate acetyltransferase, partial [Candidatus Woesearchaeota archaeon]|nr:formate acetyltransferase [Candidatus Woesearchaeota archaeon]
MESMTTFESRPENNATSPKNIHVRQFIYNNLTPFDAEPSFLKGPTERTIKLWNICKDLIKQEVKNGGVLDIDTETISSITSHDPGYINKELEVVFGLQTDAPLKRAIKPYGGMRVVESACLQHGKTLSPKVVELFTKYTKSHNDGVFDAYTPEMKEMRKQGILTGLPDNYGRGRIIGDYRRVALYGIDKLIYEKELDKSLLVGEMNENKIKLREEISEQIKALGMMKEMAKSYGFDISGPARNAREAIQWTYFAFLSALKEQDGAAMSLGNVSGFFDIYIERDMKEGKLDEAEAQELIDQFIIKLRLVRHLRMDEYNQLFAGDPTWLTETLGGMWNDKKHKVTKTTYRFLQTLYNLGPSPEPNLTVLWSEKLPEPFKRFCAKVSIETSSIQYENDNLMEKTWDCDDYGISCCVSYTKLGRSMQYFGARCNIAKALLYAINMGKDEITGVEVVKGIEQTKDGYLDYDDVMKKFKKTTSKLAEMYVNTMNIIHYMHDKYYYEKAQMALIDSDVERTMAFGIAGFSVVADSLSAIKYAKVKAIRNCYGITTSFEIEGDYPKYGNDDDRVDLIGREVAVDFYNELSKHYIYRNAKPTMSILTITANVVYGHKTGATPDGRKAGEPFAPGANPMHGRDHSGAIASLNSVA